MKKSIAFFVSSNGLGHLERVRRVAYLLQNDYRVTIYCTQWQWDFLIKTGHHEQIMAMVKFIEPNNLPQDPSLFFLYKFLDLSIKYIFPFNS